MSGKTTRRSAKPKDYSLKDHSDTIMDLWFKFTKAHYKRDEEFMTDELPVKPILTFLVKEGIAHNVDKVRVAIEQEIGPLNDEH